MMDELSLSTIEKLWINICARWGAFKTFLPIIWPYCLVIGIALIIGIIFARNFNKDKHRPGE